MPLPVTGEINGLAALHCQRGYAGHLIAIRHAAAFSATVFLACLAAMELEGVVLDEI